MSVHAHGIAALVLSGSMTALLLAQAPTPAPPSGGSSTRRRRKKAIPASKRGPVSTRRSTGMARPGFPASTIRTPTCTCTAPAIRWAQGLDPKGQPKRNPHKDAQIAGTLVNGSVLNHPPPTFSPDTGLFYINENNGLSVSYLMEPDPRGSMGLGGITSGGGVSLSNTIVAVDYKTGKIAWRKNTNGGSPGLLSTAGGVLFVSNGQNVEAWDAATGKGLWYSQIGVLQSPPETFMLDGKQHLLFTAGGSLYMFVLN